MNIGSKTLNKKIVQFLFCLLLVIGLILRLAYLSNNFGLTYDELFSYNIASAPNLYELFNKLITTDYHPPLHLLVLRFWMHLVGNSDTALQLLGVLISTITYIPLYLISKKLKNSYMALFVIFLYTFNIVMIIQSIVVRFYTLALLFSLCAFYFGLKIIDKQDKKNIILFSVFNLLLLYTQTTGIFFSAGLIIAICIVLYCFKKESLKTFLKYQLLSFIAYLPQFTITLVQFYNSKQTLYMTPWAWSYQTSALDIVSTNLQAYLMSKVYFYNCTIFIAALLLLFCVMLYVFIKKRNLNGIFILLTTILYGLFYFSSSYLKLIKLNQSPSYYMMFAIFALISLSYIIFLLKKQFLVIFLILISTPVINHDIKVFKSQLNPINGNKNSFYTALSFLIENNYQNGIIYAPYGDELLGKYIKNIRTMDIDGDKLFTMKNWQSSAKLIFDDDLEKLNLEERCEYIHNYIINKKSKKNLAKHYNQKIDSLKKGEYFTIIISQKRYIDKKDLNLENINHNYIIYKSNPTVLMAYISALIIYSATHDRRLIYKEADKAGGWIIYVFEKA